MSDDGDDIEAAIDEGWIPYFYEGEEEHGPVCPVCTEKFLEIGDDEEWQLKENYRIYKGNLEYRITI